MNKMLLIVDPQMDFISGSLLVPQAASKMSGLARYVHQNAQEYKIKVVTADWHPYDHCSFKEKGGPWPMHCVQNTVGAAIHPELFYALNQTVGQVEVLYKGNLRDKEEYSIFQNSDSSLRLAVLLDQFEIECIEICGIAGDICVLNTLRDGLSLYKDLRFNVLTEFCPSLDGGVAIMRQAKSLICGNAK